MNSIADPFLDNTLCVARLYDEYKRHPKLIIGCDFDDTVYDFHEQGHTHDNVIELLRKCQALGFYITLFSASKPERHEMMKEVMLKHGITVDSINKNPIDLPYGNCGKIFYNILLCDRAGLKSAFYVLTEVVRKIELEKTPKLYLEAPNQISTKMRMAVTGVKSVFLAGSITCATDWQKEMTAKLLPHFNVFNPRRGIVGMIKPDDEEIQNSWTHQYLNGADMILFWFSDDTVTPITLFELGAYHARRKVFIGIHPEYTLRRGIETQMKIRNITTICYDLDTLANNVIAGK